MARFSEDSFDRLPDRPARVGAHRGPKPRGRGWMVFAWAALATVLLIGGGITYLAVINNNIQFQDAFGGSTTAATPTETPTPTPTVTPITDGSLSVTILNGTTVSGLATAVGDAADAAGWSVGSMANASSTDFPTTTVYYPDPANQAAALGLAQLLGNVPVEESQTFLGASLTVVLGTDYAGPGSSVAGDSDVVDGTASGAEGVEG
ncbi:LytR C-terminal domain-containing protein [Herbiconiux solani]|uniref:LytR C-terminal domain-containing protein n=1 Tax=Herbiconiux solani TaxID=661329 RepID=UPI0009FE7A5A|nr:LytR C-terminal domain-containing protein [Herbiconiux solani]